MKWIILGTSLASAVAMADGNLFVEADHYSQINHHDYGITMFNIGIENCTKYKLCLEGKLGTPYQNNDMYWGQNNVHYRGTNWEDGDLIGGVSIKYKFINW